MGATDIPALQYTPVSEIPERAKKLRVTFFQQKTRPVEFRIQQLRKLYWAYVVLSGTPYFYASPG